MRPAYDDASEHRLAAAIEARRLAQHLLHGDVCKAIGITEQTYRHLRFTERKPLPLAICHRVAQWLEIPTEDVLCWEGYWDRLSPVGKVVMPVIAAKGQTLRELATAAHMNRKTLASMLWGQHCPGEDVLVRLESICGVDINTLRAARRRMVKPRKATGIVRRILKAHGRDGLRPLADKMRAHFVTSTTAQERDSIRRERAAPALRARWATASARERQLWGLAHRATRPAGLWGICRVCGRLTYVTSASKRPGRTAEYHGPCMYWWRRKSPEWQAWLRTRRTGQTSAPPVPPPFPGRRRSSTELADYYATAINYLRVRLRELGMGQRSKRTPSTIRDLASELGISRQGLHQRVDRLLKLIPQPAVCNRDLKLKIHPLEVLREFEEAA